MTAVAEFLPDTFLVDVGYPAAGGTGCYLLRDGGDAAVVDCGARRGAAAVMRALADVGMPAECVRYLILTHAHLDHAGAAGELMRLLPQVEVLAHSSTIKHLSDPHKSLVPAVRALYGEEFFGEHLDGVMPLLPERVREWTDDETVTLAGGRVLRAVYTPGHAYNHLSVWDERGRFAVCGDTFGVSYRQLDSGGKAIVAPVMPPSQFDPPALAGSIARIADLHPAVIGFGHFGTLPYTPALAQMQQDALAEWTAKAPPLFGSENFIKEIQNIMLDTLVAQAKSIGLDPAAVRARHERDTHLSALGFNHWRQKQQAQLSAAN